MLGMALGVGVDDKSAVEPLVDVAFQRDRMAVVKVRPKWLGVELVGEFLARSDLAGAGHTVHARRMDAVEVDGVRVAARVGEAHADTLALGAAQRWSRDAPVIGPRGEVDPRRHLDVAVDGGDLVLAQCLPVVELADAPAVPVGENVVRVEIVGRMINLAHGGHSTEAVIGHGAHLVGRFRPASH